MATLDIAVPVNSVVCLSTVVSLDPVFLNWSQSRNIERYLTVSDSSDSVDSDSLGFSCYVIMYLWFYWAQFPIRCSNTVGPAGSISPSDSDNPVVTLD